MMRLKPYQFVKRVTTAGTREQLTTAQIRVPAVLISAEKSNTGNMFIGNNQVAAAMTMAELGAGESIVFDASLYGDAGAKWDLSTFWLDTSVSTDGVFVGYGERDDG